MNAKSEQVGYNKELGWSQSKSLIVGDHVNGLTCQANRLIPGTYTAQFFIGPLSKPIVMGSRKAVAKVSWRINGNEVNRLVDCVDGASITGQAEAFRVEILDASSPTSPQADTTYVVGVNVARGSRATSERPFYTESNTVITAGGSADLVLTPEVGATSVFVTAAFPTAGEAAAPGDLTVRQLTASGIAKMYDPLLYTWVPLAPDTTILRFHNNDLANSMVVYTTLGVDG
jgi:hypothetical protein